MFGSVGVEDKVDIRIAATAGLNDEKGNVQKPKHFPVFSIGLAPTNMRHNGATYGLDSKEVRRGIRVGNREVIDLTDGGSGNVKRTWSFGNTDQVGGSLQGDVDEMGQGTRTPQRVADGRVIELDDAEDHDLDSTSVEQPNGTAESSLLDTQSAGKAVNHSQPDGVEIQDFRHGRGDSRRDRDNGTWGPRMDGQTSTREQGENDQDVREERGQDRDARDRPVERTVPFNQGPRPRRGTTSFAPGGGNYERGSGFSGRRGRGGNSFGRGYSSRYNRGGNGYQSRQNPFTVTPPTHFQQPPDSGATVFYSQPSPAMPMHYMAPGTGYEGFAIPLPQPPPPPMPAPISVVQFPLDPVRWQLLGQLEYYLSPQNMVTDFFLR